MIEMIERFFFKQGIFHPWLFRALLRPIAYARSQGDPERVHELALHALKQHEGVLHELSYRFQSQRLLVKLKGQEVMPFGTAAGLDKNGQALYPLSQIFGFTEPGTVVVKPRDGNPRPRLYVDAPTGSVYNAQGFPSAGLETFSRNLESYRDRGGTAPVYVSICGLPANEQGLDSAMDEIEELVMRLGSMADGFVWNPYSPNTVALRALRTPQNFRETADLICSKGVDSHLRLVKMGPVPERDERTWLDLVAAWLEGGGDGVVAVNTYAVPKSDVPAESWGYETAGISGAFLKRHRQRAIELVRSHFPSAICIATGGIDSPEEVWSAFTTGANALEGYTPYTFHGFGLILEMIRGLEQKLDQEGVDSLQEVIESTVHPKHTS